MRALSWLLTLSGCILLAGGFAGFKYRQITAAMAMAASFPPPYETVSAVRAEGESWTPVRRLTGTVRAPEFVEIAAEAAGRVMALPHAAGDIVPQGEVILALFDEDLQAQRAALDADLQLVGMQLKRIQQLKQESLASQDQLDTLLARSQSLKSQIAGLDAQISRMTIRAPFTGRLGIYAQSVGDLMQAGDILTSFTGTGERRWIDFKVPQGVTRIAVGDRVRLLSIDDEELGEADVIAVSDALTVGTRAYDVRAEVRGSGLRHGELVQVEVRTGSARSVVRIPNRAVRWDRAGSVAFVLAPAETGAFKPWRASARRVQILDEENGTVLVDGELDAGDLVASEGAFKLDEQALVDILGGDGLEIRDSDADTANAIEGDAAP
jgi:membrane fusion protein (multidrug efflux system)